MELGFIRVGGNKGSLGCGRSGSIETGFVRGGVGGHGVKGVCWCLEKSWVTIRTCGVCGMQDSHRWIIKKNIQRAKEVQFGGNVQSKRVFEP
jgi:hypothetical protein